MVIKDGEYEDIDTPTGKMRSHIFRPAAPGKYPGIVFYSEIFQVTLPIRRTAAFLAGHGFVVTVPEVYHEFEPLGCVLGYDQKGADRGNELKIAKEVSAYDSDSRASLDHLKRLPYCSGKLGVLGICLGGHLAFRAAMNPDVLATACFYATDIHKRTLGKGLKDNSLDRIPEIKGELLMIWGRNDPHIPQEGREIVYKALAKAERNFTWHEFNGAHAFMRDEGARYDPANAWICQGLMVGLYKRALTVGE